MSDGSAPDRPAPAAQLEDQPERTLLSWRRTALSLVAAGLLVGHLAAQRTGPAALLVPLLGSSTVVAYVWLGRHRTGLNGVALVLAVLVLGAVALVGIAAR